MRFACTTQGAWSKFQEQESSWEKNQIKVRRIKDYKKFYFPVDKISKMFSFTMLVQLIHGTLVDN